MKNTLSITSNSITCACSCVDAVADGTNSIYLALNVGDVVNPQLKIWLNDVLKSTIELVTNDINYVNLSPELFAVNGIIKFQYTDSAYTGQIFTINFPAALDGNLLVTKEDDYTFNAKFTVQGGGGGASSWDDLTNKPFKTIGNGLSVENDALKVNVDEVLSETSENPVQNKAIAEIINALSSIINSTIQIPPMVFTNQPFGVVSSSSHFSISSSYLYNDFRAFDGTQADLATCQGGWLAQASDNEPWLAYDFETYVKPQYMYIEVCNNSDTVTRNIYVEGTVDGVNWENILYDGEYIPITFTKGQFTMYSNIKLKSNKAYLKFRLRGTEPFYGGPDQYACSFSRVQIYGNYWEGTVTLNE